MNQIDTFIKAGTLVRIRTNNGGDSVVKLVQDYRPNFSSFVVETTGCVHNYTYVMLAQRVRSIGAVINYWNAPMTQQEVEDTLGRLSARRFLRQVA